MVYHSKVEKVLLEKTSVWVPNNSVQPGCIFHYRQGCPTETENQTTEAESYQIVFTLQFITAPRN